VVWQCYSRYVVERQEEAEIAEDEPFAIDNGDKTGNVWRELYLENLHCIQLPTGRSSHTEEPTIKAEYHETTWILCSFRLTLATSVCT
jgi:hypothetical protein